MQTTSAAFTAEARDETRKIAQSVQVSWKRAFNNTIRLFTIGVSSIGGGDIISGTVGANLAWTKYRYDDESSRVLNLDYQRELNMPTGGVVRGLADVTLDNTSGRYTPRYMGGSSELFTAIEPGKPTIINAGFEVAGIDQTIPQFVGVTTKSPKIDSRQRQASIELSDFINFLSNRYIDDTAMYTSVRSDQILETLLTGLGYSTAEYELDTGINIINFALFNRGDKLIDIIDDIVKAEYGHFYQDENGILRFENRYHWTDAPHTQVQQIIYTAEVINAESPNDDHIINVVEVKNQYLAKQPAQTILNWSGELQIPAGTRVEQFFEFEDPVLAITSPTVGGTESYYLANSSSDGSGTDLSSSIQIIEQSLFSTTIKFVFQNNSSTDAFLTSMVIHGRPAKPVGQIYTRVQDDSSVTAFDERPLFIDNPYIQDPVWANSIAELIVDQFSDPENLQQITIRAQPQLQIGDLISWQGKSWRIFGIKAQIDTSVGFVQELNLLQSNTIGIYFRIGVSTIGSTDMIGP